MEGTLLNLHQCAMCLQQKTLAVKPYEHTFSTLKCCKPSNNSTRLTVSYFHHKLGKPEPENILDLLKQAMMGWQRQIICSML